MWFEVLSLRSNTQSRYIKWVKSKYVIVLMQSMTLQWMFRHSSVVSDEMTRSEIARKGANSILKHNGVNELATTKLQNHVQFLQPTKQVSKQYFDTCANYVDVGIFSVKKTRILDTRARHCNSNTRLISNPGSINPCITYYKGNSN